MEVKIEKEVIGNVTFSRSTLSIKSIVNDFKKSLKDLQDLDKGLISKSELEAAKEKLKKLEEENLSLKTDLEAMKKLKDENASLRTDFTNNLKSTQRLKNENEKLKAEFEATERDRMVYYNQYHQNGKEVCELKAEVERLKNQNQALKDENEYLKETEPLPALTENANEHQEVKFLDESFSSIASALPINDSESDIDEVITNNQPQLPIFKTDIIREGQPDAKRPRLELPETEKKWKCMLCKTLRFKTLGEVRAHTKTSHPERKHFCNTCPYATDQLTNIRKHLKQHETNEMKYKGSDFPAYCSLCDVYFASNQWLWRHKDFFH